jgi:hypothetical protein
MGRSIRWRSLLSCIAAGVSAIVIVVGTATPVAAANKTTLDVFLGDCLIAGHGAPANTSLTVQWRGSDGRLKSVQQVVSNARGDWTTGCDDDEIVDISDVITTSIGLYQRTFVIPGLTIGVDRVTNIVSGLGPPDQDLEIIAWTNNGGWGPPTEHARIVHTSASNGAWSADFSSGATPVDIKGLDGVAVVFQEKLQGTFTRSIDAQGVRVWLDEPWVHLAGNPGDEVVVRVTAPGPEVVARLTGSVGFGGFFSGNFTTADGGSVRPIAGMTISSPTYPNIHLTMPNITINLKTSTDTATAHCGLAGTGVEIVAHNPTYSKSSTRYGNTGASDSFVAHFGTVAQGGTKFPLRSGTKINVDCRLKSGDVVTLVATVP